MEGAFNRTVERTFQTLRLSPVREEERRRRLKEIIKPSTGPGPSGRAQATPRHLGPGRPAAHLSSGEAGCRSEQAARIFIAAAVFGRLIEADLEGGVERGVDRRVEVFAKFRHGAVAERNGLCPAALRHVEAGDPLGKFKQEPSVQDVLFGSHGVIAGQRSDQHLLPAVALVISNPSTAFVADADLRGTQRDVDHQVQEGGQTRLEAVPDTVAAGGTAALNDLVEHGVDDLFARGAAAAPLHVRARVNALTQTAADPAYLGRVTSVVMLTMVGLAPLSYPLVGAAIGAWGAAPVFVGCGIFAGLGVVMALTSDAVRHAELPRQSQVTV